MIEDYEIKQITCICQINGYSGPARVVVTIVTDEDIPRPHAHKLVGKNCIDGNCIVELKGGNSTVRYVSTKFF